MTNETCAQCRFDGARYTLDDARGTLRSLARRWQWTIEGLDPALADRRPEPTTWSLVEYAAHSRDLTGALGLLLHLVVTGDRPSFPHPPQPGASADDPPSGLDLHEVLAGLGANADRLQRKAGSLDEGAWTRVALLGGDEIDATWVLHHALHDATHHLQDAGRVVRALGGGPPSATGRVVRVSTSAGGVPKSSVGGTRVGIDGPEGDAQADRRNHGRPWQAVCLWSLEVIEALAREGHPIAPGCAGENVTIEGLDWGAVRPGVRLLVGTALMEVSSYTTPCSKNARWFTDRRFDRIDHDEHPGWSRVYASVLREGVIRTGDASVLEPEG